LTKVETWTEAAARNIIGRHNGREGSLLPILHELQAIFGCIPPSGTEPDAGRSPRRREFLSRLSRAACRTSCAEALLRRSLPVDERRGAGAPAARPLGRRRDGTTGDGRDMSSSLDRLVMTANQIGKFFTPQRGSDAVTAIADHLQKFWDPTHAFRYCRPRGGRRLGPRWTGPRSCRPPEGIQGRGDC
jgi:hypothetical protein